MKVAELMNKSAVSVQPATAVADAARIMLANWLTGLPVLDDAGKLVGIVSEGDLLAVPKLAPTASRPAG